MTRSTSSLASPLGFRAFGFASLATGTHCIPRSEPWLRTGVGGQQGDEAILEEPAGGVAQVSVGQEGERQLPTTVEETGQPADAVERTGLGPQLSVERSVGQAQRQR